MGYSQYIDNLVYHAIINLTVSYEVQYWQKLVDTINVCSKTYNMDINTIYDDYSEKLEHQLKTLANV